MNRVVLITGANNGIGLAITNSLIEMGDRVAALDLSLENLKSHPNLFSQVCDVTDTNRVKSVVDEVVQMWDSVDIVINNACLAIFEPFMERCLDETRREFEVNYFGYLNVIKAVLPVMQKQRHGVIHNFSSGVGITGYPGISGYASTKGAIESLTRTLALELSDFGITVNLMHPPLTRTKSALPLRVPLEIMADPNEVGRKLAKKVGRTNPIITPDFGSDLGIVAMRYFPDAMGRFLSSMAKRVQTQKPRF